MSDDDVKVGYGKPPRSTRWAKGQSGNPRGRAKGSRNLLTIMKEEAAKIIEIKENGQRKRLTKLEVVVRAQLHKAMQGDAAAFRQLLPLLLTEDDQQPQQSAPLEGEDLEAFMASVKRFSSTKVEPTETKDELEA